MDLSWKQSSPLFSLEFSFHSDMWRISSLLSYPSHWRISNTVFSDLLLLALSHWLSVAQEKPKWGIILKFERINISFKAWGRESEYSVNQVCLNEYGGSFRLPFSSGIQGDFDFIMIFLVPRKSLRWCDGRWLERNGNAFLEECL